MKIKKMSEHGEKFYPATIADAVKDIKFLNEDGLPMTQLEINAYLKNQSGAEVINKEEFDNLEDLSGMYFIYKEV